MTEANAEATLSGWPEESQEAARLVRFDGSVIIERTAGEVSARCHDEEANRLALEQAAAEGERKEQS
jgi:hypothetical protein